MTSTEARNTPTNARDWLPLLNNYRDASSIRSVWEIAVTAIPFALLWAAAWVSLQWSYALTLAFAVLAAGFLLRLFLIQHDCGHGAFFRRRVPNDLTGRALSVLTLTPYDSWRRGHSLHHASSGNLDHRGIGDITTLTVSEYCARPPMARLAYRLYRNPMVLFGIGPGFTFLLRNRLPMDGSFWRWRAWLSPMATNLAIVLVAAFVIWLVGLQAFLLVHGPIVLIAASIGVWLFYIQHQFEDTVWAKADNWTVHEAALHGSSYYDLPAVLTWFTANIGVHHVHHMCSRIPFYRLQAVLRDYPELKGVGRLGLLESLSCARLALWDEAGRRLISFQQLRMMQRAAA